MGLQLGTEGFNSAPKANADARGHCASQGPSLVTLCFPIGSQGPFQAGGQVPPIHQVTKSWQGEFCDNPESKMAKLTLVSHL